MTDLLLPRPSEPLGLLLALFGLAIRIEPPVLGVCVFGGLENRIELELAICLDTSSNKLSTVEYPRTSLSQFPELIILAVVRIYVRELRYCEG